LRDLLIRRPAVLLQQVDDALIDLVERGRFGKIDAGHWLRNSIGSKLWLLS
jgi:hypothetical protein